MIFLILEQIFHHLKLDSLFGHLQSPRLPTTQGKGVLRYNSNSISTSKKWRTLNGFTEMRVDWGSGDGL